MQSERKIRKSKNSGSGSRILISNPARLRRRSEFHLRRNTNGIMEMDAAAQTDLLSKTIHESIPYWCMLSLST
jgi:hypothetical protein